MSELPKTVWHRLRRTSLASEPTDATPVAAAPEGGGHPDANLLTGFLERSLTERDRERVMNHLAACAQCREQVSLALPAQETSKTPAATPAARRFWRALRWAAVAASLSVFVTVVVLHHPQGGNVQRMSAPAENRTERAEVSQPAPASSGKSTPSPGTAPTLERSAPDSLALREAASAKPQVRFRLKEQQKLAEEAESERQTLSTPQREKVDERARPSAAAAPLPPMPLAPKSEAHEDVLDASKQMAAQSKAERSEAASAGASGSGPSQGATVSGGVGLRQAKTAELEVTGRPNALPSASPRDGERSRSVLEGSEKSAAGQTANSAAQVVVMPEARDAERGMDRLNVRRSPAPAAMTSKSAQSATRWNVSFSGPSIGKVFRSVDGGRTWREVDIDHNVRFRALAASGAEVWVGGSGGGLYHTSDDGAHWTRVTLGNEGRVVKDDIVAISFSDPQHGTATTSAGEGWSTADAGRHWSRKH